MADFCKKCSIDMWGRDTKDLADLITPEQAADGFAATGICEGCGSVYFDIGGNAVTPSEDYSQWLKVHPED